MVQGEHFYNIIVHFKELNYKGPFDCVQFQLRYVTL